MSTEQNNDGAGTGNDGGAAAGSAADFLGGAAGAGTGGGTGGDGGAGDGGAGDGGTGGQGGTGADAAWLAQFSAEGGDADNPSHRDWLKAKGFKTLDDMAKSYREAEKAVRNPGKVSIPGENATPEERAAYNKAIGVPETVEGYELRLPDGVKLFDAEKQPDGIKLNTPLLDRMRATALKAGTPKEVFAEQVSDFIAAQLDDMNAETTRLNTEAQGWADKQGDKLDGQLAHVNAAVRGLELTPEDNSKLRSALGPARALDILARLGAGMAEDVMITGGKGRFGVTGAEAQAEMDKLKATPGFLDKVKVKGSAEQMRWARLQDAVGAAADAAAKAP